jgi:tetratricopeptide (TPR) repeat protein
MRRWSWPIACVLLLGAPLAAAQSDDEPAAPEASAEGAEAPDPRLAEAMERFADAQALFERGDHSGALAEMQRVYDLLAASPNRFVVLYNLGRVYEELHRYDRAVQLYQQYLAEAPPDGRDRPDAEASLRALERLLGTIVVETNVEGSEIWIGEALLGTAPGSIRVAAGAHTLELRAPGYEPVRREVEIAARTEVRLELNMSRLSDFRGVTPAFFVTGVALAAASLGVAIGLGAHALGLRDGAVQCSVTPMCTLDSVARRREIDDFALAADIAYGAAGLFAVTSVVLLFVTDWGGSPEAPASAPAPTALVLPVLTPDGGALWLAGAF